MNKTINNLILFGAGVLSTSFLSGQKRPNIVLIMSDDIGYEALRANGGTDYQTPELDSIAKVGVRFTNCFSQPLSTPSRVKMMTGRYNCENYVDFEYLDYKERTFGNILKDAGYKTMIAGKWQLNGQQIAAVNPSLAPHSEDLTTPNHFGFDEYSLWQLVGKGNRYAQPEVMQNGTYLTTTIDDFGDDIFSNYIMNFMERNKDSTFFVYYPMCLTHDPFTATPISQSWAEPSLRLFDPDVIKNKSGDTTIVVGANSYTISKKRNYVDMVRYASQTVGKIRQKLKDLGISDNTVLLWCGDNGTAKQITSILNGTSYKGGKGSLANNGNHVSLIVDYPNGAIRNVATDHLVDFTDFVPTLCEFANVPVPSYVRGTSFAGIVSNGYTAQEKPWIFLDYFPQTSGTKDPDTGCFARTSDYKYYWDDRFYKVNNQIFDGEKKALAVATLTPAEQQIRNDLKAVILKYNSWNYSWDPQNPVGNIHLMTNISDLENSNQQEDGLEIYPNPARSVVNFKTENEIKAVEVYDLSGKTLMKSLKLSGKSFDISQLQIGNYILRITTNKGVVTKKIVVNEIVED